MLGMSLAVLVLQHHRWGLSRAIWASNLAISRRNMKKGIDGNRKSIQRVVRATPSVLAVVTAASHVECRGPVWNASQ